MPGPTVTSRVADVLDVFAGATGRLTLSELSRRCGLPLTTTHRLATELAARRLLERDRDGRYGIGLRLWEIAARAPRTVDLREAALPFLEDLYEATHENVQIAVLDGAEVVYVERILGRRAVHVVTRPGTRLAAHATGVGLVLLAHASIEQVDAVLAGPLCRYTEHTVTDPRRLRRVLADIRRVGYAISDRQIETVSASVAAPVLGPGADVVAALSIVVAAGTRTRALVPAVVAAARGVSRSLA
ncbi:MAG: IclR family transcriptional regulator [Jatrophihabitantaceae bacterium]